MYHPEKLRLQLDAFVADPSLDACLTAGWFMDEAGRRLNTALAPTAEVLCGGGIVDVYLLDDMAVDTCKLHDLGDSCRT